MTRLKDNYNQTVMLPDRVTVADIKYITCINGERKGTAFIGTRSIKVRAHPSFQQVWCPL